MAHEELGHVATLRRERRHAFHAERPASRAHAGNGVAVAAALERRLADLLEPLKAKAPPAERARLEELSEEAVRHAEELEGSGMSMPAAAHAQGVPDDPLAIAELLTDRYLEAADNLRDEEALGRVQTLAGRAIARLAWLRSDLPELETR
jgi:hypothetical protein